MTNITYARPFPGNGSRDVAIASNGLALGTTNVIRQINPVTNVITDRPDAPISFGELVNQTHRSADRRTLYFLTGNSVFLL